MIDPEKLSEVLKRKYSGYAATVIGYERPVNITYYAINLLLFRDVPARFHKSGKNWFVNFRDVEEYEIRTRAKMLAVVTKYFKGLSRVDTDIHRLEDSDGFFLIKPTPSVDQLPGQDLIENDYEIDAESESLIGVSAKPTSSYNSMTAEKIPTAVKNHNILVDRLMSLKDYGPSMLYELIPIDAESMCHDKIRIPIKD